MKLSDAKDITFDEITPTKPTGGLKLSDVSGVTFDDATLNTQPKSPVAEKLGIEQKPSDTTFGQDVGNLVKSFGSAIAEGFKADVAFISNPKKFVEEAATGITAERRDRALKVSQAKNEMSIAFANDDIPALEEATKKFNEANSERSGAEIIADLPSDIGASITTFTQASKLIPANVKSAYLQATKGAEEASVVNVDQSQKYIRETEARNSALFEDVKKKYGDRALFGLPIKVSDIAQLPQTVGFSAVSMGAGIGAGLATEASASFVVTPFIATGLAWTAGTTASGKVAYEMATYQITQQFLEAKNAESISSTGKPMTSAEEKQAKDEFQYLAMKYGLWEAVPEAISNASFVGILTRPLTKMIGTSMASAIAQKVAGLYGEELLTETITQMGQNNVEVSAGLTNEAPRNWLSPEDWNKSFKEIAPQTFLLTTLMAGAGQTIISTGTGFERIRKSLTEELAKRGATPEEIQKIVDTIPSPKTEEKKAVIADKLAEGDTPSKIALDLSGEMSTEDALKLVNDVVASEQTAKTTTTEAPTVETPAQVTPPTAETKATAVEDTVSALKTIDDSILTKTPAEMQTEFESAQKGIDDKLALLQKDVTAIKDKLDQAKQGSVQKKTLKIELAKARSAMNRAEVEFNQGLAKHAQDFRTFIGNYISSNFSDVKLTTQKKNDIVDNIATQITDPISLQTNSNISIQDLVAQEMAQHKATKTKAVKKAPAKATSAPQVLGTDVIDRPIVVVPSAKEGDTVTVNGIDYKLSAQQEDGGFVGEATDKKVSGKKNTIFVHKTVEEAGVVPKPAEPTQKEKVKEVVSKKGKATIKEIATETGILEPNVRRILGVGAKEGAFERVGEGVYRIKVGDQEVAVVIPADARETLPQLAKDGFKADMVFLDIPYDTPAVKGGNRGVKYDLISVDEFSNILDSVKTILRDKNATVVHMFSQAPSGIKKMEKYNELFTEKGFIALGRGEYQKTFADGSPVTSPNGKVAQPEGILVLNQSGKFDTNLALNFKMVRPKGYATEKPAEMLKALIEMTTNEGDVILDPFAGSGVAPAEAVKAGRKAVAIEKNKEQAKKIVERVKKAGDKMSGVIEVDGTTYHVGYIPPTHELFPNSIEFTTDVPKKGFSQSPNPMSDTGYQRYEIPATETTPTTTEELIALAQKVAPTLLEKATSDLVPADKVFYHGTLETFDTFDATRGGENTGWQNAKFGFFFSDDRARAETFVEDTRNIEDKRPVQIKEVYLDIKNPLDLTTHGLFNNEAQAPLVVEILGGEKGMSPADALAYIDENIGLGEMADLSDTLYGDIANKKLMQDAGYDGIVSQFGKDDNGDVIKEYVAFSADQIKGIDISGGKTDNKGNGKDTTDNGGNNNEGGVPSPIPPSPDEQGGAGSAVDVAGNRKRGKERPTERGVKSGERPSARLTNEEITQKIATVTSVQNGEVTLTGEITEDILEAANQYTSGGIAKEGRGILDEYYTSSRIVDMVKSLFDFPATPMKVLEPAVGTGNFIYALSDIGTHNVVAHEINETTARIAKIFHQKASVFTTSFEENFIDERGNAKPFKSDYDLVIGNPPYGEHRGKYLGLGEEKGITKYEDYFVKRGIDVLKEGGTLAMVLPSSYLDRQGSMKGVEIETAFRLPTGAFEGTGVGTDILVLRKKSGAMSEQGTAYFKNHPDNILGTVKTRKNRFGKMEEYVDGTLDEAVTLFYENNNTSEAIKILKDLGVAPTQENIENAEEAIDEAGKEAKALVKEAQKKGKETIEKKVIKKSTKVGEPVSLMTQFEGQFTDEQIAEWKDTQADGSLKNPEKHTNANYMGGKWYNDFNYAQGDIYEKLHVLSHDLAVGNITKEQYATQEAKLEAVKPRSESIDDLKIAPNITFVSDLKLALDSEGGDITLRSAFLKWLQELPRQAFGDSSQYEVREYVNNEQVRGSDKDRNELIRNRRKITADSLFSKFLKDGLTDDQKTDVQDKYNETFNFYHTPDYKKVPMFSSIHPTFKGEAFSLRDVQKNGIGSLVNKGVGILAHDVGFGKTISGVVAIHEVMHRGWAKRPIIVAPSENVYRQWISTINELIPNAQINELGNLGASFKGDLSTLKIADGSITLVTYEGFKRLGFNDATYDSMSAKFNYISDDLKKHKTEREKEKANAKAAEQGGAMKKGTRADLSFEALGFDHMTFDEVHNANHIVSKVKLEKGKASEFNQFTLRPSDLGMKTWLASQYIQEQNGGRNVNLLSATPFTNHPLEYYSILSLVADKSLQKMKLTNVNEFFGTFMEAESDYEFKADGTYQKKTDIRRFRNFRQFRKLLDTYIDFKDGETSGIVRPQRVQQTYEIPQNELGLQMEAKAQQIFKETEDKSAKVLRAITELRKIAFSPYASKFSADIKPSDYKLFVENSPKIKTLMGLIAQNKKDKAEAGQIIYVDQVGVSFMPLMKEYLVKEVGYKASEVEIISGATAKPKRVEIQDNYNKGDIKIILGSEAIKEGMNLQENTSDLYILSLPWNFTQLRQVIGRAWRQGNIWKNVRINNLFIQDSVDIFLSQKLDNKQKRYEAAIKSADQEVDVGDVSFDELKFDLIRDPETRAKLELSASKERLSQEITQAKAELAFATRKLEKINEIATKIADTVKYLAQEEAKTEGRSEWWIESYTTDLQKLRKQQAEELGKLKEKGIDTDSLIKTRVEGEAKIVKLEADQKALDDNFDTRVKEIASTLPARKPYSQATVDGFVADRAEHNKTFYELRAKESEETLKVETVVKEIKNATGTKVVKTKKSTAVTRTTKAKVSGTKDSAMLKILTDNKLSVQQKVDTLLDKRQEGKKYKDAGERVAGSKKENAIIQAVIEHGDSDILRKLADELGNEVIIEQLNKQKILEGVDVPSIEAEIKAKTPAFVASYKVGVFNRIARTPVTVQKGGRYSANELVGNSIIQDFIVKYPEELKKFIGALNAISTPEQMQEFEITYRNHMFSVIDTNANTKYISINVLGKNFGSMLDANNVSTYSGKLKKGVYSTSAMRNYTEAKSVLNAIENDGVASKFDTYYEKTKFYPLTTSTEKDYIPKTHYKSFDTKEEAQAFYKDSAGETRTDTKATFALAKTHYEAELKDLYENYDKYLPKVEMGKAKQIADAQKNVDDLMRSVAELEVQAKAGEKYSIEGLKRQRERLTEAKAFLARLSGEEVALTHGNFQAIDAYDVKDTRFKKDFVKTENLMKVYGFKSAQLGNYMDDASAHEHIVQTMASIEDMSKILGVDFPSIANKMGLSIAFGARGGGTALAHFEPTHKIINLTKKRGDGSFGHEFMHALDYILGENTYRGKWSNGNGYGRYRSSTTGDQESMLITRAFVSGVKIDTEKTFEPNDRFNSGYAETVVEMRRENKTLAEAKAKIDADTPESSYQREIYYQALADVYRETVVAKVKTTSKDFYDKSLKYGGGKSTSYWVRKEELWARAFQAYLEDKLNEAGIKNNYLTRSTLGHDVYPQGAERAEYNKLFDGLFSAIARNYPLVEGSTARFKTEGDVTDTYTMTDAGNYLADLKQRLNIDFDVRFVDNILATKNRNPLSSGAKIHIEAYGATADNTIALVREMANLTAEHESVHLTLSNMSKIGIFAKNGITKDAIMNAKARELGIELNTENAQKIEEDIANDFEAYILGKQEPKGILRKFFVLLKQLLTRFANAIGITNGDIISNYFDILLEGKEVDGEMIRLENKGIIEAYTEDGVLDTGDMARVMTRFKVKDGGDKYMQKVEGQFNDLVSKQEELETKTLNWKNEIEEKLVDREETAKIVLDTSENVKELSRYTTRVKPPVGSLTALGETMVDELGFEDKQSAEEEVQEYLKRKTELVVTRNRLRQLRTDIAKAKREGKETRADLRDVERRLKLRKTLLERKEYNINLGIGRGKKEQMRMIRLRRRAISNAQDFFALSDKKAKEIIANRNIHLMGEGEFNDFLIEFTNKADEMRQVLDIRDEAKVISNEFGKFDNLRLALGLPAIEKMSKDQAQRFVDALANYQAGDVFLSKRVLETIHRTDWGNIATERELFAEVERVTGIPKATILATHPTWADLVRNDVLLSRKNEFMHWIVNNKHKALIISGGEYAGIENKIDELTKKARASRRSKMGIGERIMDVLIPTDELVFKFIEASDKVKYQKENKLTREELALADYLIAEFSRAKDYLVKEYDMKERQNYIVHIRRSFLEILKAEKSVWSAVRELYASAKEDEASFKILNDQTGDILAFEKFFGFAMQRTGKIVPTQNVALAAKEYFRAYTKKKALDKLIPETMVITNFIDAQKPTTEKGLIKELSTAEFVKRYINNAKGRKFDFGGFLPQGGIVDVTIKGLGSVIYFKFLALSVGIQIASYGGEFVSNMRGMTYTQRGRFFTRMLNMSKNKKINEQILGVTGRSPIKELFGAEHTVPEVLSNLMFIGFSHASYTATKGYFRAVTTDEEYNTGIISPERLSEIEIMMNKFRISHNYGKSIVGATSLSGMVNRFKTWALPHLTTTGSEVLSVIRDLRTKPRGEALTSEDAKSLYRGIEITATMSLIVLALSQLGGEDDPEWLKTIRTKVIRDLNTLQQMLGIYWGSRALVPADIAFVGKLMDDVAELVKGEKYTQDGKGYGIGDLKGARHLMQDITPTAIKQFQSADEKVNTKLNLIDEAVSAGSVDAKKIAETTNPDEWNNVKGERTPEEQVKYQKVKEGEIKALFNLKKNYPDSVIGDILITESNNDKRVEKMVQYAEQVGVDKAYTELKDLYKDRNLCSDTKKKTGCMVSDQLFKKFRTAKNKL